jgi:hypothetical protein
VSAQELRRAAKELREFWPTAPIEAPLASALADWLDEQCAEFDRDTLEDSMDCPNCGTACAGHPLALWHDRCGGAIESTYYTEDPCECFAKPLAVARLINGCAA